MIDILIPTYDNLELLIPLIKSIMNDQRLLNKVIIINNGKHPIKEIIQGEKIEVVDAGSNLGWEGGLKLGLAHSKAQFVCFMNDDVLVPAACKDFLMRLIIPFRDEKTAAAGPVTNCAAGLQNIFHPSARQFPIPVSYLIGFCMLVRRSALDEVGGIDDTLPGGDDFDLSIRFRKAGYSLVIQPDVFLYHHGFVTGTKLYGGADVKGGWNSKAMTDRTNQALIKKHGFKAFLECLRGLDYSDLYSVTAEELDKEGNLIRKFLSDNCKFAKVIELGCGPQKTIPDSVGVDAIGKGGVIPGLSPVRHSVADVKADVSKVLPFESNSVDCIIARHILEHIIDPMSAIVEWKRVLKPEGVLILALPDQDISSTIPLNPEHMHAYTKESLRNMMSYLGFRTEFCMGADNGVSFVGVFEKIKLKELAEVMQ